MTNFLSHIGAYWLMLKNMVAKPENWRVYWQEFMRQGAEFGVGAAPIVIIVSIFLGAESTIQTAYQLVSPLIDPSNISKVVRDTMILELSTTVIGIILAGVIGSKIASELGNMRSTEQIDALEIMGINTKCYLILPKILGGILVIPCLMVLSAVIGIWSGRVVGNLTGIIATEVYDIGLHNGFKPHNVYFALCKTYSYAFIISSIPAYFGYHVQGGALEIGRASTRSVVVSCVGILVADYLLVTFLL